MANAEKTEAIAAISEKLRESGAAVLTEYRGLTVTQLSQLRTSLRAHATYSVVKNTLTERAAKEAGISAFDGHLQGPSAIAFVTGDPVVVAKSLRDFAKANPLLVIKAGVLDGKPLTPEEITRLADLESREVLLAKLAGAMKGSLNKAVYLFAAPLAQTARVLDALRQKVEAQGPATPAATADADSAAPTADEAPTATADDAVPAPTATADDAVPAPTASPAATADDVSTDVADGGDES